MQSKSKWLALSLATIALGWVSQAQAESLNYGLVSLNEEASATITRDEMVLQLSITENGKQRNTVSNQVTQRLNAVLRAAKQHRDFNTQLQSRSAYPTSEYQNGKRIDTGWQDEATIRVQSKNLDALNRFAAEMQGQAAIANVQYTVAQNTLEQHQTALTEQALQQFKQRAQQITRSLGGSSYKIVQLNLGNSQTESAPRPYMVARAMAKVADAAPTQDTAPGETQLSLSVNGQIQVLGIH